MPPEAIEQCAYCHQNNPVTYYEVGERPDAAITARVPICENCFQSTGR
jgi:hypothetical protein